MYYVRFKRPEDIDVSGVTSELRTMTVLEGAQAIRLTKAMADTGALVDPLMARTLASVLGERVMVTDDLPVFVHTLKDAVEDSATEGESADETPAPLNWDDPEQGGGDIVDLLESFKPVGRPN